MSKNILITGYGPGISHAVAEKFGADGFAVAIAARNADNLAAGKKKLEAKGIKVVTATADASDLASVRALVKKVRVELGTISVLHWNAAAPVAGDVLTAPAEQLRTALDTGATGLVAAVQEALPDLKAERGAVLVTDGGFGLFDEGVDNAAVQYEAMGLAIANSAKHKTVRLLSKRLAKENVFLGEVMVLGTVKGTAWDKGNATLEATAIAEQFWKQYRERGPALLQAK